MKKNVIVLFLCFFSLTTFAQSTNTTLKLDYLPEYPSEIDGACCGYYLSQEDLKNDKLLIADDFISAYMIINGKKEVLSIKQGSSKHEREFSNASYTLTITISEQTEQGYESLALKGTIKIQNTKGESKSFPFVGKCEW